MEELAAFGALCLIALVLYFVLSNVDSNDRKDKDNIDLSKHLDRDIHPVHPVDSYEGKKELRKILSNPEVRERAEERRNAENERKQKEADLKRKDTILKRTFSYKYENTLYEIFAPYATKKKYDYNGQLWSIGYDIRLENDYVISELSRLLDLPLDKAKDLFGEFENNDMIDIDTLFIKDGSLVPKSAKADRCRLGTLLVYDWNIISNEDMSLSKWIEQHPDRESKESADQRRGLIKEHIPFREYVKKEGSYSITYHYPYVEIKFNNGHILYLADSQIGVQLKEYRYRLNELIESISDKLYVDIDDERHILIFEN